MNDVLRLSRKLRMAADLLDELFIDKKKENPRIAAKITQGRTPLFVKPKKKHWTQTAKGKAKMRKVQLAAWAKKKAS